MEINLLALSVGNRRLAIGVFHAGELVYSTRIEHAYRQDWPGKLADGWKRIAGRPNAAVAAVSVNGLLNDELNRAVHEATEQRIEWVGKDVDLPINVLTDNPQETGIDRVLAVAAAFEEMGKACVVVDAGTAITVNVCDDKGQFLGGSISPGVRTMIESLHEKTAALPAVDFEVPTTPFGKNTTDAIRHGVYYGIRGMVKELVENYATELGFWPDIIATGGDAAALFEGWELIHAVAPDLLLYGIALAYAEHHIKHKT